MYTLDSDQAEINNKALSSSSAKNLVQLATGGGKTVCEAMLCNEFNSSLTLVPWKPLVVQFAITYAKAGIAFNIICDEKTRRHAITRLKREGLFGSFSENASHCICMLQSSRRAAKYLDAELVNIDEAHHIANDKKWVKFINNFNAKKIVGWSATPARTDNRPMLSTWDGFFNNLIQADRLKEDGVLKLISSGRLSDFDCFSVDVNDYGQKTRRERSGGLLGLGGKTEEHGLLGQKRSGKIFHVFGDPVLEYKKRRRDGWKTVAYCGDILMTHLWRDIFKDAGIACADISSEEAASDNELRIDMFRSGEIEILCVCGMIGEGFDLPEMNCIIDLKKTGSTIEYLQRFGRLLRYQDGKIGIYLDFVGNIMEHGLPTRNINWHQKIDKWSGFKVIICQDCGTKFSNLDYCCPGCRGNSILAGSLEYIHTGSSYRLKSFRDKQVEAEEKRAEREVVENKARQERETAIKAEVERNEIISRLVSRFKKCNGGNDGRIKFFTSSLYKCKLILNDIEEDVLSSEYAISTYFWEAAKSRSAVEINDLVKEGTRLKKEAVGTKGRININAAQAHNEMFFKFFGENMGEYLTFKGIIK